MYVEQDIELQKQKASLITNIELLENQRKIGILESEAGKPEIRVLTSHNRNNIFFVKMIHWDQ